jgi:uncharacterized membrane protein
VGEILYVSVGVLLMVTSVPLILRRVPRNRAYGVRFAATLADEWVWYEANAKGGRDLFLFGAVLTVAAFWLSRAVGLGEPRFGLVMTAVLVVGALGLAGISWVRSRRLLEQRQRTVRRDPSTGERLRGGS